MDKAEFLVKEIKTLSDNIRSKHQALKLGITERDAFLENTFKPIVTPLNEISTKLDQSKDESSPSLPTSDLPTKKKAESLTEFNDSEYEDSVSDEEEYEHINPETQTRLSIIGRDIANKGELTRKYIVKLLDENPGSKRNFHVYGARLTNEGLMIGDSKLNIDENDNITVAGKTYKGTPGLFELLFTKIPKKYQRNDLRQFHKICKDTNTYRKNYLKTNSYHKNKTKKFLTIIAPLLSSLPSTAKKGLGMHFKNCDQSNIVYYNNINELIDRARFIYDAIQSGHSGLNNEWLAIVDVLKRKCIIE